MSKVVIGILAGMGPRTSGPFLEKVLDFCRDKYGAQWDEDFPDIVLYSLPAPFRPDQPVDGARMEEALRRGAQALVRAGAEIIAVPCNVAHLHFSVIREAAGVDVLHIVRETMNVLAAIDSAKVAILATRAVTCSRLYHDALVAQGLDVWEGNSLQDMVDDLIAAFKTRGVAKSTVKTWIQLRSRLEADDITHVVIACTDLAFCAYEKYKGALQIFDSSQILAAALVDEFCRREALA